MTAFKKILVPTDFSPAAAEAFRAAVSLARTCGGEVVVAHVTRAPAVVVENGQVTPGSGAGKPLNLWNMFRALVPDDPAVNVTHEVVVAGRVSAAGSWDAGEVRVRPDRDRVARSRRSRWRRRRS
jgi:nucleotide-binding universal stress UspA family protein